MRHTAINQAVGNGKIKSSRPEEASRNVSSSNHADGEGKRDVMLGEEFD